MPSLKRGFLFQYFDKIICGVVGLVLLAGVAYALSRAGSLPKDMDTAYINEKAGVIETKLKAPAPQLKPNLPNLSDLDKLPNPPALRSNMAIPPLPVEYAPIKVGLNKEFVLQFKAPLGEGTVVAQQIDPYIEIVQHPVDGDYSKVKVRSKSYEGDAAVVGYEGRVAHIYPVSVDASVNKTAYPPKVEVTSLSGAVSVKIVPDPKIDSEEVAVAYYEIWRRAWSNPLGKYEIAGEVDPSGKPIMGGEASAAGSAGGAPAAMIPAPPPAAPAGRGGKPGPAEAPGIAWQDKSVKAGEYYSYKVRTVGQNTFPTEGDYSEPSEPKEALGNADFKFALTSQDAVRFDVVTTSAPKASFWVGIGDEIGGVPRGTTSEDYLTKDVLVTFHPAAIQPGKTGQMSRVIYADETGNLHILWQGEANSKTDALWEKATSAPATGGRAPFGPMGAGAPMGR